MSTCQRLGFAELSPWLTNAWMCLKSESYPWELMSMLLMQQAIDDDDDDDDDDDVHDDDKA